MRHIFLKLLNVRRLFLRRQAIFTNKLDTRSETKKWQRKELHPKKTRTVGFQKPGITLRPQNLNAPTKPAANSELPKIIPTTLLDANFDQLKFEGTKRCGVTWCSA